MEKIETGAITEYRLTKEEANAVCRIGRGAKCCIFVTCDGRGFCCEKMNPYLHKAILEGVEKGVLVAKGTGGWPGCPWEGED